MEKNKDQIEQIIKSEYDRIAQNEENDILKDESINVPESLMDDMYAGIEEQMEAAEREKIYAGLSVEDREALELGRKVLEEEKNRKATVKVVRKKKRHRAYIALAAAVVLALGLGVVSMGGPERVVSLVKQAVGDREVEKVNSNEENLIFAEEKEEEAYQKIEEEFGIYPVKILYKTDKMKFERMELDEVLQMAELYYNFEGQKVVYFINASYSGTSWGVDVEDEVIKSEKKMIKGCEIEVKEYRTPETNTERHSASFSYKGLEYFLIGTIGEGDFDFLINNLFFYNEPR